MSRRWLTYGLIAAFLCRGLIVFAQRPSRTPVVYIDILQGLSNNTVRCFCKDHNGFMWIGTRDGLNRYDGNGFVVFRHQFKDSNSLICNFVLTLNEDSAGKLWIGTRQGLNTYNNLTGRFAVVSWLSAEDRLVRPLSALIKDLQTDAHGNMLIGTEGLGLLLCRSAGKPAIQLPLAGGGSVSFHYGVQAIRISGDHTIWVQVQNKGLCLLDEKAGQLRPVNGQLPMAASLEYADSTLWIGDGNALYRYDPASDTCVKVGEFSSEGHTPDEIWCLLNNRKGGLLLGTIEGRVLTWNMEEGKLVQGPSSDTDGALPYGAIYGMYVDEAGNDWIGTAKGGIGLIDPERSRFHTYSNLAGPGGRPANFVTSFAETLEGHLWIGTEGDGLLEYDYRTAAYTHYRNDPGNSHSLPGNSVMAMCEDHLGGIWMAASINGISRLDPVTHRVERYHCSPVVDGLEKNMTWFVYEDKNRAIWATTLRQGSLMGALYRLDKGANRFIPFDTRLSDLFTLYEDRQGTFWGGNLSQLVAIDRTAARAHHYYEVNSAVRTICEDRNGSLWVGTEGGGLLLFDRARNKVMARYTTDEGLCNNSVIAILEGPAGELWLSTANGLSRFDPATKQFRNYYQANGLQSNEFLFNSALRLRSGEFAFGGIKGFNLFDPRAIRETDRMPRLLFTGISVNGVPVEKDPSAVSRWGVNQVEEIRVPYDKAFFSFDFAALEFTAPKEISYAYRMDDWDAKWTQAGHQRKAIYTHLDEGHYVFRVKCSNTEGKWSPREISLSVVVLPPWYRTWWAYAGYILIGGALFYLYWFYKARQARLKYEIDAARINAEKERSEHEKKLSFFTHISHEFRTPLTLIINPVKDLLRRSAGMDATAEPGFDPATAELNVIHRNARRMLSLVDQLLLFRKADSGADRLTPVKLNFYDLCREVYFSFMHQARAKNIRYEFTGDSQLRELYADREKVEIILFNLVSNALKYTPEGGAISLSIAEGSSWVEVRVADSGPGIPPGAGDSIFERFYQVKDRGTAHQPGFGIGLFLARQFARAHKGELTYHSEAGLGAVFTLRLLKGTTHLDEIVLYEDDRRPSELFQELLTEEIPGAGEEPGGPPRPEGWVDGKRVLLVIDDDTAMRQYIVSIFRDNFCVYEAADGKEGLRLATEYSPDLVISDITMEGISGIDLCRSLKGNPVTSSIPVILLTGTPAAELELEGVEGGADDYLIKPFDKGLLLARVSNLLQNRNNLRKALFDEVTHKEAPGKISAAEKEFLDKCTIIIEQHLEDETFTIKTLAMEIGISHSSLYKKVKALSGHSLNAFIRLIRLRNAAILCINSNYNVNEIAFRVGIFDRTHFRQQFQKVYGMTAAEYIRKYRKPFTAEYAVKKGKKG